MLATFFLASLGVRHGEATHKFVVLSQQSSVIVQLYDFFVKGTLHIFVHVRLEISQSVH